ncbi:MAG: gamma-glutamylcyclotransferase family protein [Acidimicrobiales bacterium]
MTAPADLLFAYGTLRTGQAHHGLLGGRPTAPAVLEGHDLRLGERLWVRPAPGCSVVGEAVEVDGATLARIDALEDVANGWYVRERCAVRLAGGAEVAAWTYRAGGVAGSGGRPVPGGDWLGAFAWYVAYGSNLSSSRFSRYLAACRDTSPPWRWAAVEVPHRLLFARESRTWGGGGVAFLDPATTPGVRTLGRAWLVTWEQLADVVAQECGLPVGSIEVPPLDAACVVLRPGHWYGCIVPLAWHQGWPMVTFTDETAADLERSGPGPTYRAVIAEGLAEAHGLGAAEASAYIARHSP